MTFRKKVFISFFVISALLLFGGCFYTEDLPPGVNAGEFEGPDEFAPSEPNLKSMWLVGGLEETSEYRCSCGMSDGNEMHLNIVDLDTDMPYIPVWGTKAYCEPAYSNDNYWTIHCQYYDNFGFPWYFVHFDVYLEQQPWTEETIGWFFWTVDGLEYFWCTLTFGIIDAELEYVWK